MIRDRRAVEFAELHAVAQERARLLELTNEAIRKLSLEADRRKELIESVSAENETLRSEIEVLRGALVERDELASSLERTAEQRLAAMAEIENAAQERLELIENLRSVIDAKDAELLERDEQIAQLRAIAQERLEAIHQLDQAVAPLREEAEKRAGLLAEMSEVLEQQDREIARLRAR